MPAIKLASFVVVLLVNGLQLVKMSPEPSRAPPMSVVAIDLVVAAFGSYTALLFFTKRASTPRWVITTLALQIGAGGWEYAAEGEIASLVEGALFAAVWIPYFLVSKRVRATFTR